MLSSYVCRNIPNGHCHQSLAAARPQKEIGGQRRWDLWSKGPAAPGKSASRVGSEDLGVVASAPLCLPHGSACVSMAGQN